MRQPRRSMLIAAWWWRSKTSSVALFACVLFTSRCLAASARITSFALSVWTSWRRRNVHFATSLSSRVSTRRFRMYSERSRSSAAMMGVAMLRWVTRTWWRCTSRSAWLLRLSVLWGAKKFLKAGCKISTISTGTSTPAQRFVQSKSNAKYVDSSTYQTNKVIKSNVSWS